ncbi:hypothetical protein [Ekhidna sp.]|uniref:hypothetical protein n=1 Tax=Ekhidna sp. TaxID=2608089 RepID=UPI0032991A2B
MSNQLLSGSGSVIDVWVKEEQQMLYLSFLSNRINGTFLDIFSNFERDWFCVFRNAKSAKNGFKQSVKFLWNGLYLNHCELEPESLL